MEKNNNINNTYSFIIRMVSSFVWKFNTLIVNGENVFNRWYNSYAIIRQPTDILCNIKKSIRNYFDKTLKEPPYDCWSGLYQIDARHKLSSTFQIKQIDTIAIFNEHNQFYIPFISNFTNKNNICVISKFNNIYKVGLSQYVDIENTTLSSRTFLSVFYKHPDIAEPIQLTIPKGMLLVGNELFNPAFVLRCLNITNEYYVFDKNYTIQIMDSEIDEYNIQYGQYLHINNDTFDLKSINI